jgi:hypothetical protein
MRGRCLAQRRSREYRSSHGRDARTGHAAHTWVKALTNVDVTLRVHWKAQVLRGNGERVHVVVCNCVSMYHPRLPAPNFRLQSLPKNARIYPLCLCPETGTCPEDIESCFAANSTRGRQSHRWLRIMPRIQILITENAMSLEVYGGIAEESKGESNLISSVVEASLNMVMCLDAFSWLRPQHAARHLRALAGCPQCLAGRSAASSLGRAWNFRRSPGGHLRTGCRRYFPRLRVPSSHLNDVR